MIHHTRCCYANSITEFLSEDEKAWLSCMQDSFLSTHDLALGKSQVRAWKDCFRVLKQQLPIIASKYPGFDIIFEYILPYESGRRPDVLLVSAEQIIVLEFKQKFVVYHADIDQAAAYARDIHEYHYESRNCRVDAVLVLTGTTDLGIDADVATDASICTKDQLADVIQSLVRAAISHRDIVSWMESKYEPLPTIVEAAQRFVKHKELPNIRRVNSTCIPQAVECLKEVSAYAKDHQRHIVAFVTGVPGAGKTFLGLQYVYDICDDYENVNSVYLSGNGPLVAVLTDALQSSVFVKDLHKVVNQYLENGAPDFHNNIVVFDEGQRAWDRQQMLSKRHTTKSEPDVIVELCSRRLKWCVLLVLVGEGQEIHTGENSGIAQWNTAIDHATEKSWAILCPDKLISTFPDKPLFNIANRNSLNLSTSLRTHLAGDVSQFANALVAGKIDEAKSFARNVKAQGFRMYVTRDLSHAKRFLRQRYDGEQDKRYGMIASSKGKLLRHYGMDNSFQGALSQRAYHLSSCSLI